MFLSIIIPVYNVEKFLRDCLDSLLIQNVDKSEYEIICIDDGSPDNSAKILKEYSENYENVISLSQKNSGPAKARNTGIKAAKGDYIWFVDSDDFIAENSLKAIKDTIEKFKPENMLLGYKKVPEDSPRIKGGVVEYNPVVLDKEVAGGGFYSWKHVVKREKVLSQYNKGLFDDSIKYGEDTLYWRICYAQQTTKTVSLNATIYYYRSNSNSLSLSLAKNESLRKKRIDDILKVIEVLKEMYDKNIVTDKEKIAYLKQCIYSSRSQILMLMPEYGIDKKYVLDKLKDIKLYPFCQASDYRVLKKDVVGFKNKLSLFLRGFFGLPVVYNIFYKLRKKRK